MAKTPIAALVIEGFAIDFSFWGKNDIKDEWILHEDEKKNPTQVLHVLYKEL
jgi:hypothetical protein